MSNWKLFKLSLSNHPGLTVGWMWPLLVAAAILSRDGSTPLEVWLTVYPVASALPWIPILFTAWSGRRQYLDR